MPVGRAIASPSVDPLGEECSAWKDGLCSMENDSAQVSWWLFLQFSPQSHQPRLSSSISGPFCLSCAGVRERGYKWNFVHWPCKRVAESPAVFPWQTESHLLFTAMCYLGSFLALVLQAGEPRLQIRPHLSPSPWNISPDLQLLPVGAQPILSPLHTPYQSYCGEVVPTVCLWF